MPHFHIVFYNSNNTFVNTKYNDFDYNDKFYVCMLKYLKKNVLPSGQHHQRQFPKCVILNYQLSHRPNQLSDTIYLF